VTETPAQDASGATIALWDGLKVDLFFTTREVERACGSPRLDTRDRSNDRAAHGTRGRGRCRTRGRTERVHRSLENRGRFSTSAHRQHRVLIKKKERQRSHRPATGLRQLPSSAAVASGAPLLTFRRQE
jgi:hypothetical protein